MDGLSYPIPSSGFIPNHRNHCLISENLKKDSALIDHFIKAGEFKNKSEFIKYAVKKTINEVILREFEEKSHGKDMPTAYFDSNVYIIGILQPNSNSRLILREIKKGSLKVIMSDYLIDEVLAWFKIHKGKDFASMMRLYEVFTFSHAAICSAS